MLQNLYHTVRTIYGDSKSGYGGTLWAVQHAGVEQGNGAGTVIWEVVSTPVLKMMKDEGFRFMCKTSIRGKGLHFVGYSFVDNTDMIQSGQPFQVLATHMQASIYGHMGRQNTGYRRSMGARKAILVPDLILLEERTVGLCCKRGNTCIKIST
jgi:hypothetical protein